MSHETGLDLWLSQVQHAQRLFQRLFVTVVLVTSSADIFLENQKLPFIRPERAMETWQEHRKILKALARHAAGPAQKAMQQHIRAAALRAGIAFITLGD